MQTLGTAPIVGKRRYYIGPARSSVEAKTAREEVMRELDYARSIMGPESNLFLAVIGQAVYDIFCSRPNGADAQSALRFLVQERNSIAEAIGIDSEYLVRVLIKRGAIDYWEPLSANEAHR